MLDMHIAPLPPAILTHAVSRSSRDQLAEFNAVATDLLKPADSDANLESNSVVLDGDHRSENEFTLHCITGPDRSIAHPDFGQDERGEPVDGL
jgi:hypothetical protein